MTNRELALTAIEYALSRVTDMTPGLDRRIVGACLEEARDKVTAIQELSRPRKKATKKKAEAKP